MSNHLITWMIVLPIVGALFQAFFPRPKTPHADSAARWLALATSLGSSVFAFFLVFAMRAIPDLQAHETLPWIGSYAISYELGVDGLNAVLVLLVAIIFPVLLAAEWNRQTGARGMYGLFLILQSAFLGAVCAQDLFLLFFFWGLSALPFYFLIGIWGGAGRESAAFRSIIVASIGNAFLFAALVLVYYSVEPHSFSLVELSGGKLAGRTFEIMGREFPVSGVAFAFVSLGLALRAAVWPAHNWFCHAAKEAPSSVFVALSAVNVPVAIYILVRLGYTLFPETLHGAANLIVAVGAVNLLVGGISAISQRDLRLLLAYVTLSEVGLILVGVGSLNPAGIVGAVYHELVLGMGLAGFGLFAGVLNERTGYSTFLSDKADRRFGGIAGYAPVIALVAGVFVASIIGFPGFGGFVGHSLLVIGSYPSHPLTAILGTVALFLATYYLFVMYRLIFLGNQNADLPAFGDLTLRERAYLLPLVLGLLICGIYPKPLLELVRPTVLTLLSTVK